MENGQLVVNGRAIRISAERDPAKLDWGAVGADYVLECTGFFSPMTPPAPTSAPVPSGW